MYKITSLRELSAAECTRKEQTIKRMNEHFQFILLPDNRETPLTTLDEVLELHRMLLEAGEQDDADRVEQVIILEGLGIPYAGDETALGTLVVDMISKEKWQTLATLGRQLARFQLASVSQLSLVEAVTAVLKYREQVKKIENLEAILRRLEACVSPRPTDHARVAKVRTLRVDAISEKKWQTLANLGRHLARFSQFALTEGVAAARKSRAMEKRINKLEAVSDRLEACVSPRPKDDDVPWRETSFAKGWIASISQSSAVIKRILKSFDPITPRNLDVDKILGFVRNVMLGCNGLIRNLDQRKTKTDHDRGLLRELKGLVKEFEKTLRGLKNTPITRSPWPSLKTGSRTILDRTR